VSIETAGKKIKLDTEAISEFLIADTDSESCSESSDFEEYFEEEEEEVQQKQEQQQRQHEASADIETQAATSGGLTTWGTHQGKNKNIHLLVGPAKVLKKCEAPYITKDSSPFC
jgi:hypothetical protein